MSDACLTREELLMATITMRDLVRDSKRVFDALEENRAPIVVTRNGRPFAALMPIDQDQAEALLLASNPEVAEMQRRAERAIAGGRTKPLSDFLGAEEAATSQASVEEEQAASKAISPEVEVTRLDDVSSSIEKTTQYVTDKAIRSAVQAGVDSPPDEKWAERIRKLNSTLIEVSYVNELKRVGSQADASTIVGRKSSRRKKSDTVERTLKIDALESACKIVYELNSELLLNAKRAAPNDIEETFESELRGGVLFAKMAGFSPTAVLSSSEARYGRGLLRRR